MTPHVPLDRVLTAVRSVHRQKETAVSTPEPSVAGQAVIDRFGIFEPEEKVEKVARAMWATSHGLPWSHAEFRAEADDYRAMARAALAALESR